VGEQRGCTRLRPSPSPSRTHTSPALPGLPPRTTRKCGGKLAGAVGGSCTSRAGEAATPSYRKQVSSSAAASAASSVQLQARSLDTPGVERGGATPTKKERVSRLPVLTEPGTPRTKASALPPSTPAYPDANTTPPAYLPPSSSSKCQRRARLEPVTGDLAVGGGLSACQVTRPQVGQRRAVCGQPEQPPRFSVERTCASGEEPFLGGQSSRLGPLSKELVVSDTLAFRQ
jgi:hypothetical protein